MPQSMTAYASGTGAHGPFSWTWELRSVNARGLDLRPRTPDWIDGLDPALRGALQQALARGSVSLSLRLTREAAGGDGPDPAALDAALAQIGAVEARAAQQGMSLAAARAADVMALAQSKGPVQSTPEEIAALREALVADFTGNVLPLFLAMRASEGAAIADVLAAQLDEIAGLVETAAAQATDRAGAAREALNAALARVMDGAPGADPDRVAQELALLAVKGDVTEEIDRLRAHVSAAREMLAQDAPVGRKLDFLSQEFNREANTLCSKSQDTALTATGLALKTVIDQMREQVQNLE
ncbi:TIGR00255 family protein [Palleronia salina]|uniref:TIGR00255 family protein n=1 Tax=Palleronia salina TaxID=313368 RepID=A0A1M6AWA6_9RHOB|nr:YicC/YloC family endoribonuclease [Palleronia salina]SHI40503.1 TIGR00255 family protein [Palleronia salina]